METQNKNSRVVVVLVLVGLILLCIGVYRYSVRDIPDETVQEVGWLTKVEDDVTFKYPEDLGTNYISAVDWPPEAQVLNDAFDCVEAGTTDSRAGKTERRVVDSREYCVTTVSEGAAGSIYHQYAYVFQKDDSYVALTFTDRQTQCANYDEIQKAECEVERQTFNLDALVDRIAKTLMVIN